MKPLNSKINQCDLFKMELDKIVDKKDPLIILSNLIDWDYFHNEFSKHYKGKTGKPPKSIRLIVGLLMLKYIYNLSDYEVIYNLHRNIYYQTFCGFFTIQTSKIISRPTLVKFRTKIGSEGSELIFKSTLTIAKKIGLLKENVEKVITDTTAIEKNIKYPTDIELLEKTRQNLVKEGKRQGLIKRDQYSKEGPRTRIEALRKARSRQKDLMMEKISHQKKMLKETLDRVLNTEKKDIKIEERSKKLNTQIENSIRLLYQKTGSKNKLYSNHEPQTYCIAKGKANKKYEYGHKLSIVIDHKSGLILSSEAILENKYDGDILDGSIAKAEETAKINIKEIYADKGYRKKTNGKSGTELSIVKNQQIHISGTKSETKKIKKDKKRRSLVESRISELKRMCRGSINYLKYDLGDKINASFVSLAENIRIILRNLSTG